MKEQLTHTMSEINKELKARRCTICKRNATLNGSPTYQVSGSGFNYNVHYTQSDLIDALFN